MNNDYLPTKDSLGFIIYRTALALKSALQRLFKEHGFAITAEQWAIIRHLWEEEGLSQREIAEKTSKDAWSFASPIPGTAGNIVSTSPRKANTCRSAFCPWSRTCGRKSPKI
jgi:hypothetical protein